MLSKAAFVLLLNLSTTGVDAFAPTSLNRLVSRSINIGTGHYKLASTKEDDGDAPDHMPELREIAPTFDAKISNTAFERYKSDYAYSLSHNARYWNEKATSLLTWDHYPYNSDNCDGVLTGGFKHGDIAWFQGAKLNVCYNAIDRHAQNPAKKDQVAMIYEGDEPGHVLKYTYSDMLRHVSEIANALKSQGVKKGDVVTIYMPMMPQLPMTILACARIGAIHSVVFAGFSSEALSARISASNSKFVATADNGMRGSKLIGLKKIVDDAIEKNDCSDIVEKVLMFERERSVAPPGSDVKDSSDEPTINWNNERDVNMNDILPKQRPYCPPESMDAEDELFILYTSGSTGECV